MKARIYLSELGLVNYLNPVDFTVQLALELKEALHCELLVQVGSKEECRQGSAHGFESIPCDSVISVAHTNACLAPHHIAHLKQSHDHIVS